MSWQYNDVFNPDDYTGFVYLITCIPTGRIYLGKKVFRHKRKRKPLKGKKRNRLDTVDSGWENYWGSSKLLLDDIAELGEHNFDRRILKLCSSKQEMSYLETYLLFANNVLKDDTFYNESISGKYYKHYEL